MKTCTTCGSVMLPTARFCGDCGAVAPASTPASAALAAAASSNGATDDGDALRSDLHPHPHASAPDETPSLGAFCTNCGGALLPHTHFCGACGTKSLTAIPATPRAADPPWDRPPVKPQTAVEEQHPHVASPHTFAHVSALPPPAVPPQPGSSSGGKAGWIAVGSALLVLVAAAAVATFILNRPGASHPGRITTQTSPGRAAVDPAVFVTRIMSVVRSDQGTLSSKLAHLASLGAGPTTLADANQAASLLRADLGRLQVRTISAPAGVRQLSLLRQALAAHRAYAAALIAFTGSADAFTPAAASQVVRDASTVDALYARLGAGKVAFQQEPRVLRAATRLDQATQARAALHGYLTRIDSILEFSAEGRKNLGTITADVRNQQTDPFTGANLIQGVVDNRTAVLDQIEALQAQTGADPKVPAQVGSLLGALHTAISNSQQADEAYEAWAASLPYDYDYAYYNETYNQAFANAGGYDTAASSAKQSFIAQYDPLARSVGLRSWSASGF